MKFIMSNYSGMLERNSKTGVRSQARKTETLTPVLKHA